MEAKEFLPKKMIGAGCPYRQFQWMASQAKIEGPACWCICGGLRARHRGRSSLPRETSLDSAVLMMTGTSSTAGPNHLKGARSASAAPTGAVNRTTSTILYAPGHLAWSRRRVHHERRRREVRCGGPATLHIETPFGHGGLPLRESSGTRWPGSTRSAPSNDGAVSPGFRPGTSAYSIPPWRGACAIFFASIWDCRNEAGLPNHGLQWRVLRLTLALTPSLVCGFFNHRAALLEPTPRPRMG